MIRRMWRRYAEKMCSASQKAAIREVENHLHAKIDQLRHRLSEKETQVSDLNEQIEELQVVHRLDQLEIQKLAAICRRDLERVRKESGEAQSAIEPKRNTGS